jgi:hypothetical protein
MDKRFRDAHHARPPSLKLCCHHGGVLPRRRRRHACASPQQGDRAARAGDRGRRGVHPCAPRRASADRAPEMAQMSHQKKERQSPPRGVLRPVGSAGRRARGRARVSSETLHGAAIARRGAGCRCPAWAGLARQSHSCQGCAGLLPPVSPGRGALGQIFPLLLWWMQPIERQTWCTVVHGHPLGRRPDGRHSRTALPDVGAGGVTPGEESEQTVSEVAERRDAQWQCRGLGSQPVRGVVWPKSLPN